MSPKNLNKDTNFIMKGNGSWRWEVRVGQGYEEAMPGDHSPGRWHCVVCCGRGSPGIGAYCLAALGLPVITCSMYQCPSTILGVSRVKSPYQKLTVLFEMNSLSQNKQNNVII